jgi:hypothetical protein
MKNTDIKKYHATVPLKAVTNTVFKLRLTIFPLNSFADFTMYKSGFSATQSRISGLYIYVYIFISFFLCSCDIHRWASLTQNLTS